jgi:hypothetical protein
MNVLIPQKSGTVDGFLRDSVEIAKIVNKHIFFWVNVDRLQAAQPWLILQAPIVVCRKGFVVGSTSLSRSCAAPQAARYSKKTRNALEGGHSPVSALQKVGLQERRNDGNVHN